MTSRLKNRKYVYLLALLVIFSSAVTPVSATINDPAYHNLDEIWARIFALQDSIPNQFRVDSIGHSQQDSLPIYAVKINSDVHNDNSRRPAIIIHVLHAEEVLGVEFIMWFIEKLVLHRDRQSLSWWRNVDTWLVPTTNPEGMNVVYTQEQSWRKNKRNNIKDGRFRFFPGWGSDTSGVDLNRNFPLFWSHGDKFLKSGRTEMYDYYRGYGPLSESESQAIDRLVERVRPLYLVTLHSSRTGNFAERIYYPWGRGWGKHSSPKLSPDVDVLRYLCEKLAIRTFKYAQPSSTYLTAPISSWNGDCDTYFYWKYGVNALRIEIGAEGEGMQPDSIGIKRVIDSCRKGIEYLFNNADGTSLCEEDDKGSVDQIRIDFRTTINGEPTSAIIDMRNLRSELMPFRETSPYTGIYHWLVLDGFTDTMTVRKFGYYSRRKVVYSRAVGSVDQIELESLPEFELDLQLNDSDNIPIQDDVELEIRHIRSPGYFGSWSNNADPIQVEAPLNMPGNLFHHVISGGQAQISLPEGVYSLTFLNNTTHVPMRIEVDLDSSRTLHITLNDAVVLLDQNFDGSDVSYSSDNINNPVGEAGDSLARWELTKELFHSFPKSLTDSKNMSTLINEDGWCAPYNLFDSAFNLESAGSAALVYWLNQALEPGYDSMWVEISTGGAPESDPNNWEWKQVARAHQEISVLENLPDRPWNAPPINLQQFAPWQRFVIPLDEYCGQPVVHFRFRLKSDEFIAEDGVYIDDVQLLASGVTPPSASADQLVPERFELGEPYPNPFNSRLQVQVNLPSESRLTIGLYDIEGRRVYQNIPDVRPAGVHLVTIDASALPSGLYVLKGESRFGIQMKKVMLLK